MQEAPKDKTHFDVAVFIIAKLMILMNCKFSWENSFESNLHKNKYLGSVRGNECLNKICFNKASKPFLGQSCSAILTNECKEFS